MIDRYMKVIGFLKNYNPELHCSRDLTDLFASTVVEDQKQSVVIEYLNNNGSPIVSFISDIYTDQGELIGPYIIYSDGKWIWPSYYSFYLKKYPQIYVPEEFRLYINDTGRVRKRMELTQIEKQYVGFIVSKMFGIKISNNSAYTEIHNIITEEGDSIECY